MIFTLFRFLVTTSQLNTENQILASLSSCPIISLCLSVCLYVCVCVCVCLCLSVYIYVCVCVCDKISSWPLDSPAWSSWPFGNLNLKEIKTFDSIDHNIACITDTLYLITNESESV